MANPPPDFVDIPFTPDSNAMADAAIENLRATWPDWEPSDSDPEVVLIESVSPMAASAETLASQMPGEAIQQIGALIGIPYDLGSPAQTTVTLTFADGTGYTAPAGGQVNIDGYAFALIDDAVIAPDGGAGPFVLAGVPVMATVNAAAANGLTGAIAVSLNLPPFVTGVSVDEATHDGTDPMDATAYQNLVVAKLRLRGDTLVTAGDFALEALLQPGVGYAWAAMDSARHVKAVLADLDALPVPSSVKTQVSNVFGDPSVRSVNVTYEMLDPTYTVVNVTYEVVARQGADLTATQSQCDAALAQVLSPLSAVNGSDGFIWKNELIALLGNQQLVERVVTLTISSPTGGTTVTAAGDLELPDAMASLPTVGTIDGTVDVYS